MKKHFLWLLLFIPLWAYLFFYPQNPLSEKILSFTQITSPAEGVYLLQKQGSAEIRLTTYNIYTQKYGETKVFALKNLYDSERQTSLLSRDLKNGHHLVVVNSGNTSRSKIYWTEPTHNSAIIAYERYRKLK